MFVYSFPETFFRTEEVSRSRLETVEILLLQKLANQLFELKKNKTNFKQTYNNISHLGFFSKSFYYFQFSASFLFKTNFLWTIIKYSLFKWFLSSCIWTMTEKILVTHLKVLNVISVVLAERLHYWDYQYIFYGSTECVGYSKHLPYSEVFNTWQSICFILHIIPHFSFSFKSIQTIKFSKTLAPSFKSSVAKPSWGMHVKKAC